MDSAMHTYEVPSRIDCQVGDLICGKYRVESVLGEGGYGKVYKVKDGNDISWAFKILRLWDVPYDIRKQLVSRFEMEFKTGCIKSRNLVHSVDYGFLKGNPYIVMEFCGGGDLTKMMGDSRTDLVKVARDILEGLNALHRNGKVHRDLKPENVLLKSDGTAVLTDFGISGDRNKRMTERNIFGKPYQMFGTYAYMPPEQVNRSRGMSTVLPTTDIFSFGVLLYQLMTGVLPFGELEDQKDLVMYQKNGKNGVWNREKLLALKNGKLWEPLISGCLEGDFKKRLQSVDEVLAMIPDVDNSSENGRLRISTRNTIKNLTGDKRTLLSIMHGKEFGKSYDLTDLVKKIGRRLIAVGRDASNDIVLNDYEDSYVSRWHFTIEEYVPNSWIIRDGQWRVSEGKWQKSKNGTYTNAKEVTTEGVKLGNGDIITVGDIKLKIEIK